MKPKKIIEKITNRLITLWIYRFPYREKYRPKGYYDSISGEKGLISQEDATCITIFPAYTHDLDLQDPFYQVCNPEIRPQPAPLIPDSFIVSLPNGRVQQNHLASCISVISANNMLVEQVSFQTNNTLMGAAAADMDIFHQKYFTEPDHYNGTVFSMIAGGACSTNYFHWLYDAVPRLYLLQLSGLFDKVDYFLVPAFEKKFHREVWQFLGLEGKKIIECKNFIHLQARILLVSSHIRHRNIVPKWACTHHKQIIAGKISSQSTKGLIYIARGDSNIRQVLNEDALIGMLQKYGFQTVLLSRLSFAEQVTLFASAKIIVAAHGAGLANISFCNEGTHLIEIFSKHYVKPTYQIICKRRNITYTYFTYPSGSDYQPATLLEANRSNILVNIEEVEAKIIQLMPHTASADNALTLL
jgi:hypothetical protein